MILPKIKNFTTIFLPRTKIYICNGQYDDHQNFINFLNDVSKIRQKLEDEMFSNYRVIWNNDKHKKQYF